MLHITIALHAFIEGWPSVDQDDYYILLGHLTGATLSVLLDEHLAEIVEWLHNGLPPDIFNGPYPSCHRC
ncbi:hypothetical protein VTO73DRAFT_8669 [Trametes versicolor]